LKIDQNLTKLYGVQNVPNFLGHPVSQTDTTIISKTGITGLRKRPALVTLCILSLYQVLSNSKTFHARK